MTLDQIVAKAKTYVVADISGQHNLGDVMEKMRDALERIAFVDVVNVDGLGRPIEVMIHDNDVRVPWVIAREALGLPGSIAAAIEELRIADGEETQ